MPRRRRRDPTAEILEDVVDTAVDAVFDRAGEVWRNLRDQQRHGLPEQAIQARYTCAACRSEFALSDIEMAHPHNGYALCRKCFAFLWDAGKEKLKLFGQRSARQQQARAQGGPTRGNPGSPPPPAGKAPYEVLGVSQDASLDEIKKAYRRLAMLWHPDRVPANASSDEKLRAKAMFDEIQRAFKVMQSVRSAPDGP